MSEVVRYEARDRVAVLSIANPPVNALSPAVWAALESLVERARTDPGVEAIVLTGAGRTFVAGSDIAAFDALTTREASLERSGIRHAVLRRFEAVEKPMVAAIHGHALGGGLELAMACHYRVATPQSSIGQPEVLLGLIPGAGGSQRLPRLCGPEMALSICTTGIPVSAQVAARAGIIDELVDGNLLDHAVAFAAARAAARQRRVTSAIPIDDAQAHLGRAACDAARARLPRPARTGVAPHAAVDAIEGCYTLAFDAGARREREIFADRVISTESRALRHLFFAEREAAKVPDIAKDTPITTVNTAAVLGAGTMGTGIAMAYASAGIPVLLSDMDGAAVERALTSIRQAYDSSAAKGRITPAAAARAVALVTGSTTSDGLAGVDIVVEAVFEDQALKEATFAHLGRVTKPECILASNTSTLDIDALAVASGRPASVIGHHFFSPAHVMKLLEVVRGRDTSREVVASSLALAKRLGKVPVVVGNSFGFVANRMLAYYMREAYLLLEEGAGVGQIDRALTEFGFAAGPFQMQDIAGIDVGARIRQHLQALGRTRADGPQSTVPDRLFEIGRYGQKTGAGWYRYDPGSRVPLADPDVEVIAEQEALKRGVLRRSIGDDEIVARVTTALANEGARVLEEGVALRAGDIDVIYAYGFGFPRYRGGPMFYADTIGTAVVAQRVKDYRQAFGDYWAASPLLERLAAGQQRFTAPTAA